MLETILIAAVVLLTVALGVACFFLWKFSKIIMIFEDDLSKATNGLNDVEDALQGVLEMQMFFDSPEVKQAVSSVIERVKLCRMTVVEIIERFTARSKQQYITVWEEGSLEKRVESIPRLPGQPPGTPNPLKTIKEQYGDF